MGQESCRAGPLAARIMRERKKERDSVPVYTIRKTNAPPQKREKKREKNNF
jgi:hypothetical protein